MLENDLILERFFARHGGTLTVRQADALNALMKQQGKEMEQPFGVKDLFTY